MISTFEVRSRQAKQAPVKGATRRTKSAKQPINIKGLLARLILVVALLSIAVTIVWYWPKFTNRPVHTVSISGELAYLSQADIQGVITPHIQTGLLDVPMADLRTEVAGLPWVDKASVARVWPDGLTIDVIEQQPVARWGDAHMLNNRGEVFTPNNINEFAAWPQLAGPDAHRYEVMQHYLELNRLLAKRSLQLVSLTQDSRGAWYAEIAGGVELVFGQGQLVEKMQRLFVIYDKQLHQYMDKAQRIDLRYHNGIAVQWRQQTEQATANAQVSISTNFYLGDGSAVI